MRQFVKRLLAAQLPFGDIAKFFQGTMPVLR
jgi:hypothetical protein